MKNKKFTSIPFGRASVVVMMSAACIMFGVLIVWDAPGVWRNIFVCLAVAVIYISAIAGYLRLGAWSVVNVSEKEVRHKKERYDWDDVFVTMDWKSSAWWAKMIPYYVFFFSDRFLFEPEIKSRKVRRNKFYMIVTKSRLECILSCYRKEIRILREAPEYLWGARELNQKILRVVRDHNETVAERKNEGEYERLLRDYHKK